MPIETDYLSEQVYAEHIDQFNGDIEGDFSPEIGESERLESNIDVPDVIVTLEPTEFIEPGKQAVIDRMGSGKAEDWELTYSGGDYSFDGEQVRDSEGNVWMNEDAALHEEMLVQWKEGGSSFFFLPDHTRQTEDGEILSITTLMLDEDGKVSFEIYEMGIKYNREEEPYFPAEEISVETETSLQLETEENSPKPNMGEPVDGVSSAEHAENSLVNDTERGEVQEMATTNIIAREVVSASISEAPEARIMMSVLETNDSASIVTRPESVRTETMHPRLAEENTNTEPNSLILDARDPHTVQSEKSEIAPQEILVKDASMNVALRELFKDNLFESSVQEKVEAVKNPSIQSDSVPYESISDTSLAVNESVQISVPLEIGREEAYDVILEGTSIRETPTLAVLEPEIQTSGEDAVTNEKGAEQLEQNIFVPVEAKRDSIPPVVEIVSKLASPTSEKIVQEPRPIVQIESDRVKISEPIHKPSVSTKKETHSVPSVLKNIDDVGSYLTDNLDEKHQEPLPVLESVRALRPDAQYAHPINDARYAKGPEIIRTTGQKPSQGLPVSVDKPASGYVIKQLNGITMRRAA